MGSGWVLIIALHTTSGKFVDKFEIGTFPTKQACMTAKISGLNQFKKSKVCVTQDHFEGRSIDSDVSPD
jgi:hypothetical protein